MRTGKKKAYIRLIRMKVRGGTPISTRLAKLKPAFAAKGTVTAGNSSQTSDGAAFVIVMSEKMINELGLKLSPAVWCYVSAGVHPRIMSIGRLKLFN